MLSLLFQVCFFLHNTRPFEPPDHLCVVINPITPFSPLSPVSGVANTSCHHRGIPFFSFAPSPLIRVHTVSTISLIQSTILSFSRFYLCPVFLTDISCRLVAQTCMSYWSCSSNLISALPMRPPLSLFIRSQDSRHSFLLIREVLRPKCVFSSLLSSLSFLRCVLPHSND